MRGLTPENEKFYAYTCFIGFKKDGTQKLLGCFHWGFELVEQGKRGATKVELEPTMKVLAGTPSWTCKAPDGWSDAIDQWNQLYDKNVQIPEQIKK